MVMSLQIIEWSDFLESSASQSAMTIGVFDGVHLGHQALIERIVRRGPNPTVLTFRENPKKIIFPDLFEGNLYSLKQKLAVFERLGVNQVVLIDFSEDFSKLKGREFLDLVENRGKMVFLAIGTDFHCGFHQDTGAKLIREMNEEKGIPTEIVPPVILPEANSRVSSSQTRLAIVSGDLKLAAAFLGRNFALDLTDVKSGFSGSNPEFGPKHEAYAYDLRSVNRVAPADGEYSVLMRSDGIVGRAEIKNRKVFLSREAESIEFIMG